MSNIVGCALGIGKNPKRLTEEKTYLLWKQKEEEGEENKPPHKKITLTNDDFVWQKLYANSIPNNTELGEYAFIF